MKNLKQWKKDLIEKNGKYGCQVKHPVTGEMIYPEQVRAGKTQKDRG